jgi:predicted transcriptional regulator
VGTIEMDLDGAGTMRSFDIANDMRRHTALVDVPDAGNAYWQMTVVADPDDGDVTQRYDPARRTLALVIDGSIGPQQAFRLSDEVTVTARGDHLLAIYVRNVTLPCGS